MELPIVNKGVRNTEHGGQRDDLEGQVQNFTRPAPFVPALSHMGFVTRSIVRPSSIVRPVCSKIAFRAIPDNLNS